MKGKVYPVHNNKFKFGTNGLESTTEEMVMPKDLENFAPKIDGTVEEWYAMDAAGWAKSSMTGKVINIAMDIATGRDKNDTGEVQTHTTT